MERKQLESAAAGNHYLRGLLAVPVGAVLVFSGLGNMQWGPFRHLWLVPAGVALAGVAYLLGLRYYNDNYARATPRTGQARSLGALAGVGAMIGVPVLAQELGLPVLGLGVGWGLVALGYYWFTVGLRPHHAVIWGAVLAVSLVPVWGDPRTTDSPNVGLILVGAAALATGILDHRLLVRTFGSPKGLNLEDSNVGG